MEKTLDWKIEQVNQRLNYYETHELGIAGMCDMQRVADTIAWLWKFRHISEEQMEQMTERATRIFDNA